ncbi:MAG TPA: hypothetical protein DHN33_10235 [Eubacteriaceae bacterium]|nr:hypothetical protein [Eubacteriaceae bacterium]
MIGKILVKSVPFMSYIIALAINLMGISLPGVVTGVIDVVASANMPIAFLLLGLVIEIRINREEVRHIAKILLVRYIVGFAFGIAMYFFLPHHPVLSPMMLIIFVLPISMSSLPYAIQFGYDARLVGTANNLSIIISFFLIWSVAVFSFGI